MRKLLNLTTALLVACAFAGATAASAGTAKAAPPKAAAHAGAASGTIESYDAAGKTLTVKASKATWTFNVADAKVWMGAKSVGVEDLSSNVGSKVTVKYAEKDGQKAASSIRIVPAKTASHSK